MGFGGSPEDLRDDARRLRTLAERVEAESVEVFAGLDLGWRSTAADQLTTRLIERRGDALAVIERIEELAAQFDELADTLAERQAVMTALLDRAREAGEDIVEGIGEVGRTIWEHPEILIPRLRWP